MSLHLQYVILLYGIVTVNFCVERVFKSEGDLVV